MPLWGSAFAKPTAELMKRFNDSFRFDRQWYDEDIRGSMVYAQAIQRLGLISADELKQILDGLARVRDEFDGGRRHAVERGYCLFNGLDAVPARQAGDGVVRPFCLW